MSPDLHLSFAHGPTLLILLRIGLLHAVLLRIGLIGRALQDAILVLLHGLVLLLVGRVQLLAQETLDLVGPLLPRLDLGILRSLLPHLLLLVRSLLSILLAGLVLIVPPLSLVSLLRTLQTLLTATLCLLFASRRLLPLALIALLEKSLLGRLRLPYPILRPSTCLIVSLVTLFDTTSSRNG